MIKRARLSSSREFERVFRDGARASAGPLSVVAAPTAPGDPLRVGLVVSKKLGTAVKRNRVKRLLREGVRAVSGRTLTGADVVIVAKPGLAHASFQEVEVALRSAFGRVGLGC